MIAALWGDDVPATVTHQVQQAVSKLRRVLGKDATGASPLVHRSAGYTLRLDERGSDLALFERLAQCGRAALADDRPADAARDLGAALNLWRGAGARDIDAAVQQMERIHMLERAASVRAAKEARDLSTGRPPKMTAQQRGGRRDNRLWYQS